MNFKTYILSVFLICGIILVSCKDFDIPPKNIVNDEDIFTNTAGIKSYMAKMYSELPIEDYKYSHYKLFNEHNNPRCQYSISGEAISRDVSGAQTEKVDYWDDAYKVIRKANYFIETLPKYSSYHSDEEVKHLLGEAYFVRAFTHYALAKRYGGVPIVQRVLNYPDESIEQLQIARNSEEDTWDAIASDFDYAIANMRAKSEAGRVNKYAAAALKSRAMLYAASIAQNNTTNWTDDNNVRICGIPAQRATDYFKQAFAAAKLVDDGDYELYKNSWSATDKEAQYKNFKEIFSNKDSKENILVKYYQIPDVVHSWDAYHVPRQGMGPNGYSAETNPTLEFVEMFDGFAKEADGTFKNLDAGGKYLLFNNTMEPFANVEPRLRATVILPGDIFKNESVEIRHGIYTGSSAGGISPLLPSGTGVYPTTNLLQSANSTQTPYTLPSGEKMNPAGASGTFTSDKTCSLSGFSLRKMLNESLAKELVKEQECTQHWIEIRYAEVLLNKAEAAYELYTAGVTGENYRQIAFDCINLIRERAGAVQLGSLSDLNSIDIIRKERRKELAFENKIWWDLRRWRISDLEQTNTVYRILMPFYVADADKYFFDVRYDMHNRIYTFNTRWYYQEIPGGVITKSPNIKQNPGY